MSKIKTPKLQIGARQLIKSAARYHNITVKDLLAIYAYPQTKGIECFQFFFQTLVLLQTCILENKCYTDYGLPDDWLQQIHDKKDSVLDTQSIDLNEIIQTSKRLDIVSYEYLFNTITLVLKTKAETFGHLPFVPELKDPLITLIESLPEKAVMPKVPTSKSIAISPAIAKIQLPVIKWNKQQTVAFKKIHAWLRTKNRKQVFRLYGWAGTGKTSMARYVEDFVYNESGVGNVPVGEVVYTAYTGKVCSVLRSKGCLNAATLHSLMYRADIDENTGIIKGFILNTTTSPLLTVSLIILDEGSFVNSEMEADLLSFGVPILLLADPGQLPPVAGEGSMTDAEPDYMLTDVERQAKENPIIYLSVLARNGEPIKAGNYGSSIVLPYGTHIDQDMLFGSDQCLIGTHNTRKTLNKRYRRLNGKADKDPIYPVKGERLICLKNNRMTGLYNGTSWISSQPTIEKIKRPRYKGSIELVEGSVDVLRFKVKGLDEKDLLGNPIIVKTQCSLHLFNDKVEVPAWRDIAGTDQFDYGYAVTVHKYQGSQAESILLIDESSMFREFEHRHRYTGITRASERLIMVLGR